MSLPVLSGQERRVLSYLAGWLTIMEIAAAMHVSPNTVKTHQRALYRKLGVHSRAAALTAAARQGWTPDRCPTCGLPI